MRNMSFFLTTAQIKARTKSVTRCAGWVFLKPGDQIRAVVKAQGLKPGEKIQPLAVLEIVSVRKEPLDAITQADCALEGFPEMSPAEFVEMFCKHMLYRPEFPVNRIEFQYAHELVIHARAHKWPFDPNDPPCTCGKP